MKEQNWDDTVEPASEALDASPLVIDEVEEIAEDDEIIEKSATSNDKNKFTDLRRRIEERLDSKRLALEIDYEDMDNWSDNLQ